MFAPEGPLCSSWQYARRYHVDHQKSLQPACVAKSALQTAVTKSSDTENTYTGFLKQHNERSNKADAVMIPDVSCSNPSTSTSSVEKCISSSDASRTGYKPDMVQSCNSVCAVPARTSTYYVACFQHWSRWYTQKRTVQLVTKHS